MKPVENRRCEHCKYAGADPDGVYCAHPKVLKQHFAGLSLWSKTLTEFCPGPSKPLFEKKQ